MKSWGDKQTVTQVTRISGNKLDKLFLEDLNKQTKWVDNDVGQGGCTIFIKCYHTDRYTLYTHGIYWKQFTDGYSGDDFGFMLVPL